MSHGTVGFQLENNNVLDAESDCGQFIEAMLELNTTTLPENSGD